MYVVKPPMDGLPYLNCEHGWLVYIVHYALLAVFCVTACYAKPILSALRRKKTADAPAEETEKTPASVG